MQQSMQKDLQGLSGKRKAHSIHIGSTPHLVYRSPYDLLLVILVQSALVKRAIPCTALRPWAVTKHATTHDVVTIGSNKARTWVVQAILLIENPRNKLLVGLAHVWHVHKHDTRIVREDVLPLKPEGKLRGEYQGECQG